MVSAISTLLSALKYPDCLGSPIEVRNSGVSTRWNSFSTSGSGSAASGCGPPRSMGNGKSGCPGSLGYTRPSAAVVPLPNKSPYSCSVSARAASAFARSSSACLRAASPRLSAIDSVRLPCSFCAAFAASPTSSRGLPSCAGAATPICSNCDIRIAAREKSMFNLSWRTLIDGDPAPITASTAARSMGSGDLAASYSLSGAVPAKRNCPSLAPA